MGQLELHTPHRHLSLSVSTEAVHGLGQDTAEPSPVAAASHGMRASCVAVASHGIRTSSSHGRRFNERMVFTAGWVEALSFLGASFCKERRKCLLPSLPLPKLGEAAAAASGPLFVA